MQRTGRGRPLRFLAAVGLGWIAVRATLLWPDGARPVAGPIRLMIAPAHATDVPRAAMSARPRALALALAPPERIAIADVGRSARRAMESVLAPTPAVADRSAATPDPPAAPAPIPGVPSFVVGPRTVLDPVRAPPRRTARWSGSAWAVTRVGGTARDDVTGGQLGGSQAGLRIVRTLDRRGRVALAGRLTTPIGAGLREASLGLEWQPTRLPLRLVAEHRFVMGAGTGGPGIALVGGFGPVPVLRGVRAEAYAQAGVLHRTQTEPYADAALRLTHGVARIGGTRIELGAGTWGGAQRGAARLDVGPTLAVTLPVARKTLRLTLDWRERVAGWAKPGSGPALTVGTDF